MVPTATYEQQPFGYHQYVQRTIFSPIISPMHPIVSSIIVVVCDKLIDWLVSSLVRNGTTATIFPNGTAYWSRPVLCHPITTWIHLSEQISNHCQYSHQHHLHTLVPLALHHHWSNIIQLTLPSLGQSLSPLSPSSSSRFICRAIHSQTITFPSTPSSSVSSSLAMFSHYHSDPFVMFNDTVFVRSIHLSMSMILTIHPSIPPLVVQSSPTSMWWRSLFVCTSICTQQRMEDHQATFSYISWVMEWDGMWMNDDLLMFRVFVSMFVRVQMVMDDFWIREHKECGLQVVVEM